MEKSRASTNEAQTAKFRGVEMMKNELKIEVVRGPIDRVSRKNGKRRGGGKGGPIRAQGAVFGRQNCKGAS